MGKQILMNAIHQKMMLKAMTNRNMTMNDSTHMIWMEKEQIIPSSTPGSSPRPLPWSIAGVTRSTSRRRLGGISMATPRLNWRRLETSGRAMRILRAGASPSRARASWKGAAGRAEHRQAGVVLEDGADDVGVRGVAGRRLGRVGLDHPGQLGRHDRAALGRLSAPPAPGRPGFLAWKGSDPSRVHQPGDRQWGHGRRRQGAVAGEIVVGRAVCEGPPR